MFEATLTQGSVLKSVLEAIKDLVTEGNFECTKDGMRLQAMDSSHVSLVVVDLKADGFQQYRCDRPQTMGISMANLAKILKCAGKDDSITLKANDSGDTVMFTFVSSDENRISDFELKLMDIDSEHLTIPEEEYSAQVTTPAGEYARICKDLTTIGDTVTVSVTKDGIKFSTSGDVGSANVLVRNNHTTDKPEEHTTIVVNEPVTLTFALRYLSSFCKATPLSSQVVLGITKDLPIVVEYPINDLGHVRYYLAPKIEDEDMEEHEN